MKSLFIAPGWEIPATDIEVRTARSSGPGGQNVNKVESKVELRLDLSTRALTAGQRHRLLRRYPGYLGADGSLRVVCESFRTQKQNLREAEQRLVRILLDVRRAPTARVATKPTRASKRRRLLEKRRRGDVKRSRSAPSRDE